MTDPTDLSLGGVNDEVTLEINDKTLTIVESYEIKVSVMTQPAAFTLRVGSGDIAKELLKYCPIGGRFKLYIGGVLQQSGRIDARGVPSNDATVIEIKGRDYMRALFNHHVEEDVEFKEKTYYDLTRKVMDLCGLKDHELVAGNGANRQAVSATKIPNVSRDDAMAQAMAQLGASSTSGAPTEEMVRSIATGIQSAAGAKMEFKALKAKIGQRWIDWLQDKYKLVGLFLWCAGDGKFILATPQPNVEPSTVLVRQRGVSRNTVNIESHSWRDDATNRHGKYIVYARFGAGKGGRNRIRGEYVDEEMVGYGLTEVITYHDDDCKSQKDAEYLARKYAAEERRAGWELSYTVAGHRTPSLVDNGVAVWGPDTASKVTDDELGIKGPHYLEAVTYKMSPHKTTTLELIRPEDLLYLAEQNPEQKKSAAKAYQKAVDAPTPEAAEQKVLETDWQQFNWKEDAAPVAQNRGILFSQT